MSPSQYAGSDVGVEPFTIRNFRFKAKRFQSDGIAPSQSVASSEYVE